MFKIEILVVTVPQDSVSAGQKFLEKVLESVIALLELMGLCIEGGIVYEVKEETHE